jgi:(p)ppGpp synthase/HD superfamily hydrolase
MSKELDREAFSNFVRALAFASRKHSQQRRKDMDASPYINHPIALVSILAVEGGMPVMLPIPGTSKVAHLEENVAAVGIQLSDAEFDTLDREGRME